MRDSAPGSAPRRRLCAAVCLSPFVIAPLGMPAIPAGAQSPPWHFRGASGNPDQGTPWMG